MVCRIAELQYKEIIDVASGARYGFVSDVEVDLDRGVVSSIIIQGQPRLWGLLGRDQDLVFPWSAVRRVGDDIILVDAASLNGGQQENADFFLNNW